MGWGFCKRSRRQLELALKGPPGKGRIAAETSDIQSVRRHKEGMFIASRVIAGTAIAGKITVCHQGACAWEVSQHRQSGTPPASHSGWSPATK